MNNDNELKSLFGSPVKFREEWAKCQCEFYEFSLGSNLLYTFGGPPLGRLESGCQKNKGQG